MHTALHRNKDNRKTIIYMEINLKNKLQHACQYYALCYMYMSVSNLAIGDPALAGHQVKLAFMEGSITIMQFYQ